jgi:hypothetical protein
VTVATVDETVRLRRVETWFDPMEMFRQIVAAGEVKKEKVESGKGDVEIEEGQEGEETKESDLTEREMEVMAPAGCPHLAKE